MSSLGARALWLACALGALAISRPAGAQTQVALGSGFGCGLGSDAQVRCWGDCDAGQCGSSPDSDAASAASSRAVAVPGLTGVTQIAAGYSFACARRDDGSVWCWGSNRYLQLGHTTDEGASGAPAPVPGLADVDEIALGGFFACARSAERVSCWGGNSHGQLGVAPTLEQRAEPQQVVAGASRVYTGSYNACVVDTRGRIRCWGASAHGQSATSRRVRASHSPRTLRGATRPTQLALGGNQACLRMRDGALRCWGENVYSAGDGTAAFYSSPQPIPGLPRVDQVAVRSENQCALFEGRAYCWGVNRRGHLQVPTDEAGGVVLSPSAVPGLDDATELVMGWESQCVRHRHGGWSCWGRNRDNAVGVGSTDSIVARPTPLPW